MTCSGCRWCRLFCDDIVATQPSWTGAWLSLAIVVIVVGTNVTEKEEQQDLIAGSRRRLNTDTRTDTKYEEQQTSSPSFITPNNISVITGELLYNTSELQVAHQVVETNNIDISQTDDAIFEHDKQQVNTTISTKNL